MKSLIAAVLLLSATTASANEICGYALRVGGHRRVIVNDCSLKAPELSGDYLWVKVDGREITIRDREVLDRASALFRGLGSHAAETREIRERVRELQREERQLEREHRELDRRRSRGEDVSRERERLEREEDRLETEAGRLERELDEVEERQREAERAAERELVRLIQGAL